MRHGDRVLLSVRTDVALGAHEKPRRGKSLRTKGPVAQSPPRPAQPGSGKLRCICEDNVNPIEARTFQR